MPRRAPALAARSKSFRDRLDPLLGECSLLKYNLLLSTDVKPFKIKNVKINRCLNYVMFEIL